VIYNGDIKYATWRGAVSDVLFGKDVSKLADATQVCGCTVERLTSICHFCLGFGY
jgi:hypothetical protein